MFILMNLVDAENLKKLVVGLHWHASNQCVMFIRRMGSNSDVSVVSLIGKMSIRVRDMSPAEVQALVEWAKEKNIVSVVGTPELVTAQPELVPEEI